MQKANRVLIFIFFAFLNSCATERKIQSLQSPEIFVEIQNPSSLWLKSSENREDLVRENSRHFWAWARAQSWTSLQELLKFQGQVTGDPHIGNFSDVHNSKGVTEFSVVDIDDGGRAPLILDFIKFASYVKFVYPEMNYQAVYQAYIKGLSGETIFPIDELKQSLEMSYADLQKKNFKKIDKKTKQMKFKKEEMELSEIDQLPVADQKTAGDMTEYLLNKRGVDQILDVGFRIPAKGGSKGKKRFLYLVKLEGRLQVLEFKELGVPATAYYRTQKSNVDRIQALSEYYFRVPEAGFAATNFREKDFWLRPKYMQDFDDDAIEDLDFATKSKHLFYIANYLGVVQKRQTFALGYIQELQAKTDRYNVEIEAVVSSYVQELKRLSGL